MQPSPQTINSAQPGNPTELAMTDGLLDSAFIIKLRETFITDDAQENLWNEDFVDPDAADRKALIAADIASAFRSAFMRCEKHADPEPGTANSAAKMMAEVLEETDWPTNVAEFPVLGDFDAKAFRRYEVACAMYIIMQAYQRGNPGGGPTSLPPSRPE
jgi:hypothetical protein